MAESNDVIGVELRATVDQFTQALRDALGVATRGLGDFAKSFSQVGASSVAAGQQIQGAMTGMGAAVEGLMGTFGTLLGVLAGGAVFREFVQEARHASEEVDKLNRIYGLTSEQTQTLDLATRMVGSTVEQFTGGMNRLTRQIASHEDRLNSLGLVTRDSNGHFLDTMTIMTNTGTVLGKYAAGEDRLTVATQMFGRNIELVNAVMRMTPQVLAEAEHFHESLNVRVGREGVAAMIAYDSAMAKVVTVVKEAGYTMGSAIMPTLTAIAETFADTGPIIIKIVKAIAIVIAAWGSAILDVGTTIKGVVGAMTVTFLTLLDVIGDTIQATVNLHTAQVMQEQGFPEAADKYYAIAQAYKDLAKVDWTTGMELAKEKGVEMVNTWKQHGEDFKKLMDQIWNGETKIDAPKGGKPAPKMKEPKDRTGAWEKAMKYIEATTMGSFENMSAFEADYWLTLQQSGSLTMNELWAVTSKFFEAKKKELHEDEKRTEENYSYQEYLAKGEYDQLNNLAVQWAHHIAGVYGANSAEAHKADLAVQKSAHEMYENLRKMQQENYENRAQHTVRAVENERSTLDAQVTLGMINAQQRISIEREMNDHIYAAERASLELQLALAAGHTAETKKLNLDLEKLEQDHQQKMVKSQYDAALAVQERWMEMLSVVSSAFSTSITGMIMGTQTWRQALGNIFQSILGSFVDLMVRMGVKYAAQHMGMMALDELMASKKAARDVMSAATGSQVAGVEARLNLASFAASGAVAAGASVAAIPVYGWAMAPEVMASTYGEFMAMEGAIPAAAKGMVVPGDMLAMVHTREMVLPADLSQGVQDMVRGGGGAGGGPVQIHIAALDAKSVKELFMDHSSALYAAWRKHTRDKGVMLR